MSVDVSAVARVLGIATEYKDLRGSSVVFLPQAIGVVGQGATASTYATTPFQSSSAADVGTRVGFGSPLHLAAKKLFPINGDGVGTIPVTFYPMVDNISGNASSGDITPSGAVGTTSSIYVYIGEVRSEAILIEVGDSVAVMCDKIHAAISAILDMPMTSADGGTQVNLTSKWKGLSANEIDIRIEGSVPGVTFGITQPSGGLTNPDVNLALANITTRWETMILNCLNPQDENTLEKYRLWGEGRWGPLERKPVIVFTGRTAAAVPAAGTESDGRRNDRINAFLVAPGSGELPLSVAARQLARIAKQANEDPATDYGAARADQILPGPDGDQWTYAERDEAVKKGCSTIVVKDGVINLSDIVTMYHPTGDALPAYRYAVDIVKLQNTIFNLDLVFATDAWNGAPLIPDGQATTNPNARTPAMAVAAVNSRLEALALAAIISDPEAAKASTTAAISTQNPKRLEVSTTVQLSGNTNIVSVTLNFGFYFGAAQLVA